MIYLDMMYNFTTFAVNCQHMFFFFYKTLMTNTNHSHKTFPITIIFFKSLISFNMYSKLLSKKTLVNVSSNKRLHFYCKSSCPSFIFVMFKLNTNRSIDLPLRKISSRNCVFRTSCIFPWSQSIAIVHQTFVLENRITGKSDKISCAIF